MKTNLTKSSLVLDRKLVSSLSFLTRPAELERWGGSHKGKYIGKRGKTRR